MICSRGYSTQRFKTLQTAYYNKPTALQQVSYNVHMIGLVRSHNTKKFEQIMSCGISPNPCNSYGESLVHMVCRRGDDQLLKIMLDNGCDIQVADDYGRTPLHDACWAAEPAFDVVKMILERDVRLFHFIDARGHVPLSYVRKEHWEAWIHFIDQHKDIYWPTRPNGDGSDQEKPLLCQKEPNSRPIPDPTNALSQQLAGMVAAGRMEPQEATFLKSDSGADATETSDWESSDDEEGDDNDDDDDSDGSYDSDYDSEDDSDYDSEEDDEFDEDMNNLLNDLPC